MLLRVPFHGRIIFHCVTWHQCSQPVPCGGSLGFPISALCTEEVLSADLHVRASRSPLQRSQLRQRGLMSL